MIDFRKPKPIFLNLSAPKGQQDLSAFVLYLHTHKEINATAGTWEVVLVPQPDPSYMDKQTVERGITKDNFESIIYRSIRPMDVVIVGVNDHEMWGFVDNPYKSLTRINDQVTRSITVRGRDGMKAFMVDSIANAPALANDPNIVALLGTQVTNFMDWIRGLGPDGQSAFAASFVPQAVYWILQNVPSLFVQLTDLGNTRVRDVFKANLVGRAEDMIYDDSLTQYAGQIINYMQQVLDGFYEFWVDTLPANSPNNLNNRTCPVLFVRPKPFDREYEIDSAGIATTFKGLTIDQGGAYQALEKNPAPDVGPASPADNSLLVMPTTDYTITSWEKLTCPVWNKVHAIPQHEITNKTLGVSDYEVANLIKVLSRKDVLATSQFGTYGLYFPLIDAQLVRIFGLREMQVDTGLIPTPNDLPATQMGTALSLESEDFDTTNAGLGNIKKPLPTEEPSDPLTFEDVEQFINIRNANRKAVCEFLNINKRDRLWRWTRYNHIYESGLISFKGRDVHAGSKLFLPDEETRGLVVDNSGTRIPHKGMEFYCLSVDQEYHFGEPWISTAAINRGHNPQELRAYHTYRGFDKVPGGVSSVTNQPNGVFTASLEGIY
jgi:hypothetical protein